MIAGKLWKLISVQSKQCMLVFVRSNNKQNISIPCFHIPIKCGVKRCYFRATFARIWYRALVERWFSVVVFFFSLCFQLMKDVFLVNYLPDSNQHYYVSNEFIHFDLWVGRTLLHDHWSRIKTIKNSEKCMCDRCMSLKSQPEAYTVYTHKQRWVTA